MGRLLQSLKYGTIPGDHSDVVAPMQQLAARHAAIKAGEKVTCMTKDDECGQNAVYSESIFDVRILIEEVEAGLSEADRNSPYHRKAKVLAMAISDIGMGRYQRFLFNICGLGWTADSLWLGVVALSLTTLKSEFGVNEEQVRMASFCLIAGLIGGATFWSLISDYIGRRVPFLLTLPLAGTFGILASQASSWPALCAYLCCVGLGVGGNLPVDGTMYMEFLPPTHSRRLVLMATWWSLGSLISAGVSWPLMTNFSCDFNIRPCRLALEGQPCCSVESNWGWRYAVLTVSVLTLLFWLCRVVLVCVLLESPKSLLARGRQAEAVAVLHAIAHHNGVKTWLTVEILDEVGWCPTVSAHSTHSSNILRRIWAKFPLKKIFAAFQGQDQTQNTSLLWSTWLFVGMGYPLFNAFLAQYLAIGETSTTMVYGSYLGTSACGLFGPIAAYYLVDRRYFGRVRTMAAAASLAGLFIFLFAYQHTPNMRLGFSCMTAFLQNAMYAVLYAYTPESFPTPVRGTGSGGASVLNRLGGLCAPIIAIYLVNPTAPIYVSAGLCVASSLAMYFLPIETRDRQSL